MACYDPNSLTASGGGELSVHLKEGYGLNVGVDGIYVDFANTGCESGLHLSGGKLSTLQTPSLGAYNGATVVGGGYSPLPVSASGAGAVQTNFTGHIPFVNNSCYTGVALINMWCEYDVDCEWLAEWQGRQRIYVNGNIVDTVEMKHRNDMNVVGGRHGAMNRFSHTFFWHVGPNTTTTFGLSTVNWAHHGTVALNRSWVSVGGFILSAPPL